MGSVNFAISSADLDSISNFQLHSINFVEILESTTENSKIEKNFVVSEIKQETVEITKIL